MLSVLEQNPGSTWEGFLGGVDIAEDRQGEADVVGVEGAGDNELSSFKL